MFRQGNNIPTIGKLRDRGYNLFGPQTSIVPRVKKKISGNFRPFEEAERTVDEHFHSSRKSIPGRTAQVGKAMDHECSSQRGLGGRIKGFFNSKSQKNVVGIRTFHLTLADRMTIIYSSVLHLCGLIRSGYLNVS